MSNTFNFRRFLQVVRLSWQTQPVLPYIVLVAMIPLLVFLFAIDAHASYVELNDNTPFLAFTIYFFICGWLYAGMAFDEMNKKGSASRYLMLPVSALEKWLATSLLAFVLFPCIIWLTFNLVFEAFGWMSLRWEAFHYKPIDWGGRDFRIFVFMFYISLPAAYASGVAWKRFGIAKGLVFFILLCIVLFNLALVGMGGPHKIADHASLINRVDRVYYSDVEFDTSIVALARLFWIMAVFIPSTLLLLSSYFFTRERTL